MTNEGNEAIIDSNTNEGEIEINFEEGEGETNADTISISKSDYEKMNQTLGSLKREIKDLRKSKDEPKETSQNKPDESRLLEKLEKVSLRQAGITHSDDIELARNTAKKWNMDIDDVLADDDFRIKLERQQTNRANLEATSNIKGSRGATQTKFSPEYWVAKGTLPSATDVPDRKLRAKIARTMMDSKKNAGKFYNE